MKKLSILTIIIVIIQTTALSQPCLPEGITFTTQAQIDSFQINYPNCTEIEGDVTISGEDITDLSGLSVLTSIGGNLMIGYNPVLSSLTGLLNLTFVGGELSIGDWYGGNPSLTDLTGLDSLTTVCGRLNIKNNDSLVSLTGLENLTSVHGILVGLILYNAVGVECFGENPRLESIAALSNLTSIEGDIEIFCNHSLTSLLGLENISSIAGNLIIAGNDTLANLDALFNLDTIYGSLEIGIDFWNGPGMYLGNPNLTNLSGLSNLSYIGGDLNIERNESLTSLSGLNSLTGNVNNIEIIGNHSLTSLMGLDNLDAGSINNLTITCNSSLSSCKAQGICDYLANPCGIVEIYDNAPGCNSPGEIANNCGFTMPCLPYGNYYFTSQAEINNFPAYYSNCTDLQGNVTIGGSDISNLNGLTAVTSVSGNLYIGNNDTLANLSGLDNVTSISGQLWIVGNGDLTSLTGLENIDPNSITGLDINYNSSLSTCAVRSICDYLASPYGVDRIHDNALGCNSQEEVEMACEGEPCPFMSIVFDNQSMIDNFRIFFPDCNEIDGDILIEGNNITSLAGLGNLTSIGGDLNIGSLSSGNPYLSILEGLDKLTNLGGNLHIHTNPILTSLTGLNNLETIGKRLIIWSNDSLTSIASLENLSSIGTDLIIMNNNSLSICSAWGICYYLSNPNGNVGIWDNAPGCNSREEVEEACTESVDEVSIINNLSIYPNPFTNTITIEYELKQPEIVTITIYNYLGEQLEMMRERMSVGQQKTEWNCAEISAGIYFCVLKTNKGIQTTKIIKL